MRYIFFLLLFFSSIVFALNPLATPSQRELDQQAIKIYDKYPFELLRKEAAIVYKKAYRDALTDEAKVLLQPMIDELVFSALQKAINDDAYHPEVYWVDAGPRDWFELSVPGGRYSYDNPDVIYRTIPIRHDLHYVIHGQRHTTLGDATFSLISNPNTQNTIAVLTNENLVVRPDGSYDITIDSEPANGRPNHLQSTIRARQLFIRNSLVDWNHQIPDSLSVKVLEDVSNKPKITEAEIVEKTKRNLQTSLLGYGVGALGVKTKSHPVNTLPEPKQSSVLGTLVTQASSFGHFKLADNEGLLVTVHLGGASYFVLPVTGPWTITLYPGHCQSSLNQFQAVKNSDGDYRFVISKNDPGVHNWVSTCGLDEGTIMARWQGLPVNLMEDKPTVKAERVNLVDLANILPQDTQWVSPVERADMLKSRLQGYLQRSMSF